MRLSLLALLATVSTVFAAEAPPDYRFKVETLIENIPQPMQLQRAPDGRIFFIEIAGKVKIYHPDTKQVALAATLDVTIAQENGLLGMALDPQFATTGWIYLLHSPKDFAGQFISRFTVKGDTLEMDSRKDLLSYAEQRRECCHHAGALRFGPDGCLYASSGDNTNPFASGGFTPIDERPNRDPWDAQKSSANTNDLRGKILRIKPKADGTYEIPPGNLFPPGTPNTRPEIFAMGFRNPWRFNIDQTTGIVYVGDVGPDSANTKEDRGPNGFDTINQLRQPGYYGWPYSRGNEVYLDFDFATNKPGEKFDPLKPVNASANNTGLKELPPVQAPLIWYPARASKEFPILGSGGRTACAGPVFHFDPKFKDTGGFPEHFDKCLLFYDWQRPFIKWARLDKDAKLEGIENFTGAVRVDQKGGDDGTGRVAIRRPADMVFGSDGALYLFDYGSGWGVNKDSKLLKISYQWGNLTPLAKISGKAGAGREPLDVELSAEGSKDPEGEPLAYEWRLQPGDKIVAKTAVAKFTVTEPGEYRAEVRVSDPQGGIGTATVPVMVGNTVPVVAFESPANGDFFFPGQPVKFKVAIKDFEDGPSSAKADDFGIRTLVSALWKTADGKESETDPGIALMKQNACFNCHAVEQPLVGPPLLKIAEIYRGVAGAENESVKRVINGSTGVWGQVGMLPHPHITEDEVHFMVRWIYSLQPGKASPGMTRGLTGEIPAPGGDQANVGVLEASYTDAGRPPKVGPATGHATLTLRSARLEAEMADEIKGPQVIGLRGASQKKALGAIGDQHFVKFTALNLAGVTSATVRAASGGAGGKVEFHAGSQAGPLLGEAEVKPTGGADKWTEIAVPLQVPATARGDVFVVFVNAGQKELMNLDWVQFNAK